jgi:hypothetical protein
MSVIDSLLQNAAQDTQLLEQNDSLGDVFSIPRDVDFIFFSEDASRAEVVCSFITDNQYGQALIEADGARHKIRVVIHMPTTQHVLCAVSGMMTCVASLFQVEYDGWGCVAQRKN